MSSLSANKGNIKSVMRTALVGIKPADQVMLKGYLRILLRLEADLEWVSANHPEVDLFMINNDFKQAANIIKLLQANDTKPVLYIGRANQGLDGRLENDLLTLPLKDMQMLNDWLFNQVGVLQGQDSGKSERRNTAEEAVNEGLLATPSTQPINDNDKDAETIIEQTHVSQKQSFQQQSSFVADVTSSNPSPAQNQAPVNAASNALLAIIQSLRNGISGRHKLSLNNEVFAIIEPSKGLIWTKKSTLQTVQSGSFIDWNIESTTTSPSSNPHDLKQWLWGISKDKLDTVYPFIDPARSYQLSYWVKPTDQDNRSDLLRVMTAIEADAKTPQQIAEVSGVAVENAHKMIVGLFFSGFLQPDNYKDIKIIHNTNISAVSDLSHYHSQSLASKDTQVTEDSAVKNVHQASQSQESPLDTLLSKRAAGESTNFTSSSSIPSSLSANTRTSSQPRNLEAKPEKKGFLSRLRSKLGL